jgi:hypothetical protein
VINSIYISGIRKEMIAQCLANGSNYGVYMYCCVDLLRALEIVPSRQWDGTVIHKQVELLLSKPQ